MLVAVAMHHVFARNILDQNPELKPEHARLVKLSSFSFSLILLYSVYGSIFRRVNASTQIVLSFVLYMIKQFAKHRMWTLSHVQDHHDLSAESVACGVHLFHALYMTTCLQSARSYGTLVTMLVLNVAHTMLALYSIRQISRRVDGMLQKLQHDGLLVGRDLGKMTPFHAEWTAQRIQELQRSAPVVATSTAGHRKKSLRSQVMRSAYFRHQQVALQARDTSTRLPSAAVPAPVPIPATAVQPINRDDIDGEVTETETKDEEQEGETDASGHLRRMRATRAVAHLMHCREVVLLRLFVDIFVPLFYLTYCTVLLHVLPHRNYLYFESLVDMDRPRLLALAVDVAMLVAIKLLAYGALHHIFRVYGQPSGLEQLVFVVRSQRWTMQTWFLTNFLQIMDFPLVHMGNDLSFQFTWIRKP